MSLGNEAEASKVPWIKTPLIYSKGLSKSAGCNIYLKLENLQPSGSFKSRGIGNFLLAKLREHESSAASFKDQNSKVHFYSSSGGNAGLGCVHAAVTLGCAATIVVPLSTTSYMIDKLHAAGATEVIQEGKSWAEADHYLVDTLMRKVREKGEEAVYVPPFDAQYIWDGNAQISTEIFEQLRSAGEHYNACDSPAQKDKTVVLLDAIICSVGGGGLFCGIMQGLDSLRLTATKVLTMETIGAESLNQAIAKKKLVTLPAITSIATSLGARTVCEKALDYGLRDTVISVVLSDAEAVDACKRFASDERFLVEPACGVCLALCYEGRLKTYIPELRPDSNVSIVVCGGSNISFELLGDYVEKYCS